MLKMHDVIIIGGGAAGLSAGIYTSRGRLKTLLVEKGMPGGSAATTDLIENYPGFPDGINGMELMDRFERQAERFGVEILQAEIKSVKPTKDLIDARTDKGNFSTFCLIVATGSVPKKLNIPGEDEFRGKGVSYCATCDGPLFKGKALVVIGGGDAAVEEALFLTRFGKSVTLIHRRDRLRATKILQERAVANPKIDFIWGSVVTEIFGNEKMERIKIKDVKTERFKDIPCQGLFISIGIGPNTKFLEGVVRMDREGYVVTDENMKTSCEGIYACGDCRKKLLHQVVTACGDGATAAMACKLHVEELKGIAYK